MLKGGSADPGTQAAVADEVNDRLVKAQQELVEKYQKGKGGQETSVDGPTGKAYREGEKQKKAEKKAAKKDKEGMDMDDGFLKDETIEEDNDEDNFAHDDDDYELRKIRDQRIRQMKEQQSEKLRNLGKGHGQYREIVQDEFLSQATSSERVICHFYHDDFPRCAIMDMHLQRLAARHVETKFVKINAAKAPFFVDKLKILSIPTVILFVDGIAVDKIIGFEGLADNMPEGKVDEWPTILLARLLASKRMIFSSSVVDDEGIEAAMKQKLESRKALIHKVDMEDDDFNLDD